MLNFIPLTCKPERPKTQGFAQRVQYFSSSLDPYNKKQQIKLNRKTKDKCWFKKSNGVPRTAKQLYQNCKTLKISGHRTFDRMKTDGSLSYQRDFQLTQGLLRTRKNIQQQFSLPKNPTENALFKTQMVRIGRLDLLRQTQYSEGFRRLIPRERQRADKRQKKYKLLNLVGNKMKLCRIDCQIIGNPDLFLSTNDDSLQ